MLTASRIPPSRANQTHVLLLLAVSALFLATAAAIVMAAFGYFPSAGDDAPPGRNARQRSVSPTIPALPAALAPLSTTPSDPTQLRPLDRPAAVRWNAAIAVSDQPVTPAAPFRLDVRDTTDWDRAVDCLTAAVYYEAAIEPTEGQRAVAQVVLNRVRHPAYPHTVCGTVFQGSDRRTGCQFTFSCDGALRRTPNPAGWARARSVAVAAIAGYVYAPAGLATHYHTNWIVPYWSSSLIKLANIGTHIFYRWDGGWGTQRAFSATYRGAEPAINWRGGFGQTGEELAAISATSLDGTPRLALPIERPLLGLTPPAGKTAVGTKAGLAPQPGVDVGNRERWILRTPPQAAPVDGSARVILPPGN